MIPTRIGRYEIKSELGRGGMATVYRALDPRFKREVAVKVLPSEFLHDPTFRARFEREAETIAALEHPAIVPVYDYGEEAGQPYLVMRLMMGGSLADRLARGPLSISETARIFSRLAPALDRAHVKGIIHRDLKPGNILFDGDDNPYISDFGLAKLAQGSGASLSGSGVMGTPAYMSPEQARGEKEIDGRSDLYAVGAILFQMLTGRVPYEADTPIGMVIKHVTEPAPHVRDVRPDLSVECDDLIQRAMAKDKEARFPTADSLTAALTVVARAVETQPNLHLSDQHTEASRLAHEQAEREREARAQAERERQAYEQAEAARQAAEQQRLAERAEQQRLAREQAERERQAQEAAERESVARAQAEHERRARETAEPERLAREQETREQAGHEQEARQRTEPGQLAAGWRPLARRWWPAGLATVTGVGLLAALVAVNVRPASPVTPPRDLLFVSSRSGQAEIYRLTAAGDVVRVTTSSGGESWEPVVDAQGNLVFTSNRDGKRELYRLTTSGETVRVTRSPGASESWGPAIDQAGNLVFTSNRDGKRDLYRLTASGETVRVTNSPGGAESWEPAIDPAGNLLFTSNRDGKRDLYRLTTSGGTVRVTHSPGASESWGPRVDPAGDLVFTSNRDGKRDLYRLTASGEIVRVTDSPGQGESWTSSGED